MAEIAVQAAQPRRGEDRGGFAEKLGFTQLFWIFFAVSFLGCAAEGVFMLLTRGELQNRSGVLYGPFSLVWGLGAVLFTALFARREKTRWYWLLLGGTAVGAAYEYACSWLQEVLFGACFWDYNHLPLNINGRVNLVFSLFWGVAAVAWVKGGYPLLRRAVGHIPPRLGRPLTAALAVLMAANIALTGLALGRMDRRNLGQPARSRVEEFLDRRYPDERLRRIFTNLTYIGTPAARAASGVPRPNDLPGE